MTVMMSLLLRPYFPTCTFAKGTLYATPVNLRAVHRMSLRLKEMECEEWPAGDATCGNAQQRFVANRNADE